MPTRPLASRSWRLLDRQLHPECTWPRDLAAESADWPGTAHSGDERYCHHRLLQNDLSDEKVKQNIRDADLDELQAIFDRAAPKRYDRADVDQKDRLDFLAQDLQNGGVTGKTMWGGEELLTLDYGKLTAVLWGVCKKLQARVDALEKPKKPKTRRGESPRGR